MRFHVISLPHTQVTRAFSTCAYTEKVRKFCDMMSARGHDVFLYAPGPYTDATFKEFIHVTEKPFSFGTDHYTGASFDWNLPHWQTFNLNVIKALGPRLLPHDFICVIAGLSHKPIADAFPNHMTVEFGIGYGGTFSKYRVFESAAWMHTVYGAQGGWNPHDVDGRWYDAVIPNYWDPTDFPTAGKPGDYFFYLGRMVERKGVHIAQEVCERTGDSLILAGPGKPYRPYGNHIGEVGPSERGILLAGAKAVFCPTLYIEPFGGAAVEAMLCGTPVITTDWGAFTETVQQGVTGYRCRTFADFVNATKLVEGLDREAIRRYAVGRYSLDAVAPQYEAYFQRLLALWNQGWYDENGIIRNLTTKVRSLAEGSPDKAGVAGRN